jgi:hypothetical protein
MLLDCDDPLAVHKFCSILPAFVFEARPVVPIMAAVPVELEAMPFVMNLKSSNGITPKTARSRAPQLLAPRRRSGRAKSLPNVAYWHFAAIN